MLCKFLPPFGGWVENYLAYITLFVKDVSREIRRNRDIYREMIDPAFIDARISRGVHACGVAPLDNWTFQILSLLSHRIRH